MEFTNKRRSKPLRVAMVGTGYFGRFHYSAWQRMQDVRLVGLFTADADAAVDFQEKYNVDATFQDMASMLKHSGADLIDIVSPPHTHAQYIRQCLEAGTAVICQKPFCSSPEEAAEVVSSIKATKTLVAVHENFRFQPWYQHIKKIIEDRLLGDIYEINFNFRPGDGQGAQAYLDRQPYFQTQDRFFIQETGIHFIDVFRFLLGDITGIFARLKKLNPVIKGEDAGVVILEFANGARGILNGNRLSDHEAVNTRLTMGEMRIEGADAVLTLNGNGQIHIRHKARIEWVEQHFDWQNIDFGGDCVFRTCRHIADHLLEGSPIQNHAKDYLVNRQVEDAIYRSAASRKWLQLR